MAGQAQLAAIWPGLAAFVPERQGAAGNEKGADAPGLEFGGRFLHIRHHDAQLMDVREVVRGAEFPGDCVHGLSKIIRLEQILQVYH